MPKNQRIIESNEKSGNSCIQNKHFTNIFLKLRKVILGNPNMKKASIGFEDLGYSLVMQHKTLFFKAFAVLANVMQILSGRREEAKAEPSQNKGALKIQPLILDFQCKPIRIAASEHWMAFKRPCPAPASPSAARSLHNASQAWFTDKFFLLTQPMTCVLNTNDSEQ